MTDQLELSKNGNLDTMKHSLLFALLCTAFTLTACQKKAAEVTAESPVPARETAAAAQPAAEPSEEQQERARKQELMDYAVMEDAYINDAKAQWASAAKASSTFGDEDGKTPSEVNSIKNATGKVDGEAWLNNSQDIGFDWVELSYDKPVFATEVRWVSSNARAETVETISKIELQDSDGKWNTVWSGISEQKKDERGPRTWFVQKFEKTTYPVKAVKFTIANNLHSNYKELDAAQLVGE